MDKALSEPQKTLSNLEEAQNFARKHLSILLALDGRRHITGWWATVAHTHVETSGLLGFEDGSTEKWTKISDFAPWFQSLLEEDHLARQVASQLVADKLARGAQLSPEESLFTQKLLRGHYSGKQGRHWADNRMRDLILAGAVKFLCKNYSITKEKAFSIVANAANEVTRPLDKSKRLGLNAASVKKIYLAHGERKITISFT